MFVVLLVIDPTSHKLGSPANPVRFTAVALATLKGRPHEAKEFWSGVAKNDGLKKGDPRHTFVMDMLTRTLNKGDMHQTIAVPATAWNAWLANKSLTQIHVVDTDYVRIAGTTFQG
ncbi:hypothetical protein [Shinella zoogloeoides]|uniref:hypothetical protein n=1 Tax=Shinella zoogloeoides TaxID=352475 RepID=UPI001F5AC23E|nr:hypothetical protein [Shinella zoogloeoides]